MYLGKQEDSKKDEGWIGLLSRLCGSCLAASSRSGAFLQIRMGASSSEQIQCHVRAHSSVSKMWAEFQPPLTSQPAPSILKSYRGNRDDANDFCSAILGCVGLIGVVIILGW